MTNPKVLEVDALKYLERQQPFDGRREDLPIFIANIEDIIPVLNQYDAAGQQMLINTIKSKITGKARTVIEINSHLNTWVLIKNLLITNFSSFKSIQTLQEELRAITFKSNTLDFYNEIMSKLSELNQKSKQENSLMDIPINIMTGLKIFKSKINEPMRTILYARNPTTIENALNILSEGGYLYNREKTEHTNKNYFEPRNKQYNNNNNYQNRYQPRNQDFKPQVQNNYQRNNNYAPRQNYGRNFQTRYDNNRQNFPRNDAYERRNTPQQNTNANMYNRQNIQPRPEPMDVDTTAQTRRNNVHIAQNQEMENFHSLASQVNYHM